MGDGKDGWMSLMRNKTFWKVITGLLFFPTFAYGLLVISMYWWPSIPSTPRPAEGRIYPLNNHGEYAYMNRREHLMHEVYPPGDFAGSCCSGSDRLFRGSIRLQG
jgi:hypothetical protein